MKEAIKQFCIRDILYEEANIEALHEIKQDGIRLQEYLDKSSTTIITKANNLIRILIVIISALIGFVLSKGSTDWDDIIYISIATIFILIIDLILLHRVAYGIDSYFAIGTQPEFVLEDDIFKHKEDADKNLKELLRFNIQNIQREISSNLKIHQLQVDRFRFANLILMVILVIVPVILIAIRS